MFVVMISATERRTSYSKDGEKVMHPSLHLALPFVHEWSYPEPSLPSLRIRAHQPQHASLWCGSRTVHQDPENNSRYLHSVLNSLLREL